MSMRELIHCLDVHFLCSLMIGVFINEIVELDDWHSQSHKEMFR
jgi:hypothetical protein